MKIKGSWVLLLLIFICSRLIAETTDSLFNLNQCIKDSTKDCIDAACIEHSPTNCRVQCKEIAVNKCHRLQNQPPLPKL